MDYELLANGKVQIGGEAPSFSCNSTMGNVSVSKEIKKWHVLFSYNEDFYPVATSEMILLEQSKVLFEELETEVIAMSTGNLLSHIAWINDIYRKYGIQIKFPIIEDPIGEICRKYGMISKIGDRNMVMSSSIIIDDNNIVRAVLEYSPQIERNIYEIVRIIKTLKS